MAESWFALVSLSVAIARLISPPVQLSEWLRINTCKNRQIRKKDRELLWRWTVYVAASKYLQLISARYKVALAFPPELDTSSFSTYPLEPLQISWKMSFSQLSGACPDTACNQYKLGGFKILYQHWEKESFVVVKSRIFHRTSSQK